MGGPHYDDPPPADHVWTCPKCRKRVVAWISASYPGAEQRLEESKYHAAVAKHQMEGCPDGQ